MIKTGSFLFFIASVFCPAFSGAEVKVQSTVPTNKISLGEQIVVTVSISSDSSFNDSEPAMPTINGFGFVNSWSSSNTNLVFTPHGKEFQTRKNYYFRLSPAKTGRLVIPAFHVTVDGKDFETKPIIIQVNSGVGSTANNKNKPDISDGTMEDMGDIDDADKIFKQLLRRRNLLPPSSNKVETYNPNELFFLRTQVDKTSVYEGEQVTASWYIYTKGPMLSLDRLKFPELRGFWKEPIEEVPPFNFTSEVLNGISYSRTLLAEHALFPIKPGVAIIDEYKIKASIQTPGLFGVGTPYSVARSSEQVKIQVKPLPTEGRPKNFVGAVGSFELRAFVDRQNDFPANQPFSLKVRFDGSGNAKSIDRPALDLPPGLEVYDMKSDSKFFKNGTSYKEFEILIIPRQEGNFVIPGFSVSLFDPATSKYYGRSSEPISIRINPEKVQEQSSLLSKEGFSMGRELALPEPTSFYGKNYSATAQWVGWLQIALWAMVFGGLVYKARRVFLNQKRRDISEEFDKRCLDIFRLVEEGNWRKVGIESSNLIYFVLGKISGQGKASQEASKLLELTSPSLRNELGSILQKHIDRFQLLGFAPDEITKQLEASSDLKGQVGDMIDKLRKALSLHQEGMKESYMKPWKKE